MCGVRELFLREQMLFNYFDELVPSKELEAAVYLQLGDREAACPKLRAEPMDKTYKVRREHLIRLIDSGIAGLIKGQSLQAIFGLLFDSKQFLWRDPLVGELLNRVGDANPSLKTDRKTLLQMRTWLTGTEVYPESLPRLFTRWLGPARWMPTLNTPE